MAIKEDLEYRASQIKNETEDGRNTANRIGGLFVDLVDVLFKQTGILIKRTQYDALVEAGQVDPEQTYLIEEEE